MSDPGLPCSLAAAGEPLPGTAPPVRWWLIVEHPGPWGRDALTDARWPGDLGARLRDIAARDGVRLVLGRRHRARAADGPPSRPRVVLARAGAWAVTRRLDGSRAPAELDRAELFGDDPPEGWDPAGPVWAVCTHASRDACCARLGRPLAAVLAAGDPDRTWEISHSGGHRFAGVLLALPEGTLYGRVTPSRLDDLLAARAAGEVVPDLLRGHTFLEPWQQAAEAALRDHLGEYRSAAVLPAGGEPGPEGVWRTRWWHRPGAGTGLPWGVEVRSTPLPARRESCGGPAVPARSWTASVPVTGWDRSHRRA